jgi:hypothetical protein
VIGFEPCTGTRTAGPGRRLVASPAPIDREHTRGGEQDQMTMDRFHTDGSPAGAGVLLGLAAAGAQMRCRVLLAS